MSDEAIPIEILTGFWRDLKEHAVRGAVFLVSSDLDFTDVALKVVSDNAAIVGRWIEQGKFARPTPEQIQAWTNIEGKSFRFVILQPHVLIQELGH